MAEDDGTQRRFGATNQRQHHSLLKGGQIGASGDVASKPAPREDRCVGIDAWLGEIKGEGADLRSRAGLALAKQLYEAVRAQGYGRKGTQALLLALEHINNVKR